MTSFKVRRRVTFWTLLIGYIGYYLCRGNLSAALPLLSREFSLSNQQLGAIGLYSEIVYAIGKFINGPLGDKLGGKKIFLIGMIGAITFNIMFGFASSLSAFVIIWCLARYFLSMGWGGLVKVIAHWYEPENHGKVMGLISVSFQFGGVAASLFAGYLVALGYGWQYLFFYPAGVLSLMAIVTAFLLRDRPLDGEVKSTLPMAEHIEEELTIREVIRDLWKTSVFQNILVFAFVTTFLRSIFFFWTPKFLSDMGMSDSSAILKSALFPLLGCVGTYLLGWYTDHEANRSNRAGILWICLLISSFCLLGVAWLVYAGNADGNLILVLMGLCGFFILGPYSMSAGVLTLDIAGKRGASSCAGIVDGFGYLGGSLAVWLTGYLADRLGWWQVFVGLAIAAFLAMLSAIQLKRAIAQRNL